MKKINIDKKVIITAGVTTLLIAFPSTRALAAGFNPDKVGNKFWGIVKIVARWGCIIMCAVRMVQNLGTEDAKGLFKIFFRYALVYALIVFLPAIYNEIDNM